jgi:hypothetical protein
MLYVDVLCLSGNRLFGIMSVDALCLNMLENISMLYKIISEVRIPYLVEDC